MVKVKMKVKVKVKENVVLLSDIKGRLQTMLLIMLDEKLKTGSINNMLIIEKLGLLIR